jgi:hypothetical protein
MSKLLTIILFAASCSNPHPICPIAVVKEIGVCTHKGWCGVRLVTGEYWHSAYMPMVGEIPIVLCKRT